MPESSEEEGSGQPDVQEGTTLQTDHRCCGSIADRGQLTLEMDSHFCLHTAEWLDMIKGVLGSHL